ncbi:MAG: hypothetical protein ACUVS5_13040 [Anaerolineae bacterium]
MLWDQRLNALRVTVDASGLDRSRPHFRIIAAWITVNGNWDDVPAWAKPYQQDTLGGDHHAYGRTILADGSVAMGAGHVLTWRDGQDMRLPEPDGWANIPLYAGYDPRNGPGPYTWAKVGNAEKLTGIGLPYYLPWAQFQATGGVHVSFFAVWQEVQPQPAPPPPPPMPPGGNGEWTQYMVKIAIGPATFTFPVSMKPM